MWLTPKSREGSTSFVPSQGRQRRWPCLASSATSSSGPADANRPRNSSYPDLAGSGTRSRSTYFSSSTAGTDGWRRPERRVPLPLQDRRSGAIWGGASTAAGQHPAHRAANQIFLIAPGDNRNRQHVAEQAQVHKRMPDLGGSARHFRVGLSKQAIPQQTLE